MFKKLENHAITNLDQIRGGVAICTEFENLQTGECIEDIHYDDNNNGCLDAGECQVVEPCRV